MLLCSVAITFAACNGEQNGVNTDLSSISVTTGEATEITDISAVVSAAIVGDIPQTGDIEVGFIYSENKDEVTAHNGIACKGNPVEDSTFSATLTNLSPTTEYHYCAYVKAGQDIKYGDIMTFSTDIKSNRTLIENFVISDYGMFGDVTYIDGTAHYVHLTTGDSMYCQLGYIILACWDDGLTYAGDKGYEGNGMIFRTYVPVYWVLEGKDKGKYLGSAAGFFVEECNDQVKPYIAESGALVDLQKYGDYFSQLIAHYEDENNPVDYDLYYDAQKGTQLYNLNADAGTYTYFYGNVKKAQLKKVQDKDSNTSSVQFSATIEWYDIVSEDRFLGLKATFDEENNLKSIIKPYDMNTFTKEYTNITEGAEAPVARKVSAQPSDDALYILGDQSRLHLGENPFPIGVKPAMMK